ncbi:MAG: 1-(5-phosphoribosyl)-5-[(5-phosphoribosylamino)methylideneamino]imidazole-4-carboxamide isomerase [Nitrospirae bacterium]|nr:MAG: 1-(5-phosphoribosyl)-5-[(5-phosphoribosylamino)methylideneamino]imidazole-4-carboxamide isomerase [Nitrospirota bacterium]
MIVIPAIDLKEGKCVRLLQGKKEQTTIYSDDPVEVARRWADLGAKLIHIVDLDGAFTGNQKNQDTVRAIRDAVDVELELGGGIRDMEGVRRWIELGINRVILGTVAIKRPELVKEAASEFPGQILVGIDAKDGRVAIKGWEEVTQADALQVAKQMESVKVAGIIYTDISRDGMLTGPNIEATKRMVEAVDIPVIASGGVSSLKDIENLKEIKGLWGVITGKALYTGRLDLKEAISLVSDK